jgi:hypothetical protein
MREFIDTVQVNTSPELPSHKVVFSVYKAVKGLRMRILYEVTAAELLLGGSHVKTTEAPLYEILMGFI